MCVGAGGRRAQDWLTSRMVIGAVLRAPRAWLVLSCILAHAAALSRACRSNRHPRMHPCMHPQPSHAASQLCWAVCSHTCTMYTVQLASLLCVQALSLHSSLARRVLLPPKNSGCCCWLPPPPASLHAWPLPHPSQQQRERSLLPNPDAREASTPGKGDSRRPAPASGLPWMS